VFPQTALVTGGASGIGAATVRLLEAEGAEVQALDLSTGFDVSDPAAWESVGPVEFAYLNAGVTTGETEIASVTEAQYRRILGANVDGVVYGVRRLAQVMEPGSAIVATASLAGIVPTPGDPLYSLTKHAVVGFVRSVAPQLEEKGIRINAVCPGIADTPLIGDAKERLDEANFPLLTADEVAAAALMAARSGLTGQAWALQPGREPVHFKFPNVPGPRVPGSEGRRPPGYQPTD
jgi:NAD(P)-dependent dehydrogenase (short-subunit alcohol dehydrogenase family)